MQLAQYDFIHFGTPVPSDSAFCFLVHYSVKLMLLYFIYFDITEFSHSTVCHPPPRRLKCRVQLWSRSRHHMCTRLVLLSSAFWVCRVVHWVEGWDAYSGANEGKLLLVNTTLIRRYTLLQGEVHDSRQSCSSKFCLGPRNICLSGTDSLPVRPRILFRTENKRTRFFYCWFSKHFRMQGIFYNAGRSLNVIGPCHIWSALMQVPYPRVA